jgi:hypothetical protein
MQLLNKSELAESIGHDPTYVSAMCKQGYQMKYGTRTTRKHALAWLAENPGFRVSSAYPSMGRRGLPGRNRVACL